MQGREFWLRFVMTFRKFSVQYGVIQNYSKGGLQYAAYVDQAFMNIHEDFVEGTLRANPFCFPESGGDIVKHKSVLPSDKGWII